MSGRRWILVIGVLLVPFAVHSGELDLRAAQAKLATNYVGVLSPYARLSFELASLFLTVNPDLSKVEPLVRRELGLSQEVSIVEFSDVQAWQISISNSWNFYLSQTSKAPESGPFLSLILSHTGRSLGSASLSASRTGVFRGAQFEYFTSPGELEKTLTFDEKGNLIVANFFVDLPILSWQQIYGRNIEDEIPERRIRVGVIDSGVDYNHPAIARHIPRFTDSSGDLRILGVDLENSDDLPFDLAKHNIANHGTSVAGVLVEGAPFIEIVPVVNSELTLDNSVEFLHQNRVRIVNLSQEVSRDSDQKIRRQIEDNWVQTIEKFSDVLFVLAAGNDGVDILEAQVRPQSLAFPNAIVVGALNREGGRASFQYAGSNYNRERVQVVAIGNDIWAPVPGGIFSCMGGTSFAAPQITRLAANFSLKNPNWGPHQIIQAIEADAAQAASADLKTRFQVTDFFKFGVPPASLGEDSTKRCPF